MPPVNVTGPVSQRTVVAGTEPLVIGNGAGRFSGALDEVAVYNKALTAADVTRHYASR